MPLVLNSSSISGLAAVGGLSSPQTGSVLQVVSSVYGTYPTSTSSTSFVTTGHTLSITPTSATSKILLISHFQTLTNTQGNSGNYTFARNGTNLNANGFAEQNAYGPAWMTLAMNYLDSPATTSAITYAVFYKSQAGTTLYYCGNTNEYCVLTAMEIAA